MNGADREADPESTGSVGTDDTPPPSSDPEGELMAERSVIAMSQSVIAAARPSHSVLKSSAPGVARFTVEEEKEEEESKEEISASPFDTSLDANTITIPHRNWNDLTTTNESDFAAQSSVDYGKDQSTDGNEKQAHHPEAASRSGAPGLFSSKKNVVIGVLALLALILAIVLIVILLQDDSSSSSSSDKSMPTELICATIVSEGEGNEMASACTVVVGHLAPPVHPNRTWSQVSVAGTCQNSALLWLLGDESILQLDRTSVQQRYSLAVTLCELEGGNIQDWEEKVESTGNSNTPCFTIDGKDADQNNATSIAFNPNCDYKSIRIDGGRDQQTERRTTGKVREDSRMLAEAPRGTLAPELSIATSLEIIKITNGLVKGKIPPEYGELIQLKKLDLSNNKITGSIPPQIVTPQMEELLLHGNGLTGTFSVDLEAAPKLRVVSVYNNSISGDFEAVCEQQGGIVFAADLDEVNCSCCNSTLPPGIDVATPTASPVSSPATRNPITAPSQVTAPTTVPPAKTPAPFKAFAPQTLTPVPCEPNTPWCEFVMATIVPVFPPANVPLLDEQGTCQNWARNWLVETSDPFSLTPEPIRQRFTMALLYCEFDGEEWNNAVGGLWLSDQHECEWLRINNFQPCNNGRLVQALHLPGLQINGTLPPELSIMTSLRYIDFSDNQIFGRIPSELGRLTGLEYLNLQINNLTGSMPGEVCSLRNRPLSVLVVDCPSINSVTGAILPETGVVCECCSPACGK